MLITRLRDYAAVGVSLVRNLSTLSAHSKKKTLRTIRAAYERDEPLTMLTAYDYPSALHADLAGVDMVLVGDSLGMVVLGKRTTQSVTVDQMVHHTAAARRGVASAMLVADLPFGSYETGPVRAVETAMRLIKEGGADAVKLEGGVSRAHITHAVVDAGIAVVGHVGLMPQAVSRLGGFRAMGKSKQEACEIFADARAVEESGAFAVVVECVPAKLAEVLTNAVDIPTIGIGSGVACGGQVLVYHDMLGILSHPHHAKVAPKFSKFFAELGPQIHDAIGNYCRQVKERDFPNEEYTPYSIGDDEFEGFCEEVRDKMRKKIRGGVGKRERRNVGDGKSDGFSVY